MEKLSIEEKQEITRVKREWNRLNKNRLILKDYDLSNIKNLANFSNEVNKLKTKK